MADSKHRPYPQGDINAKAAASLLVLVSGPDPAGAKARAFAFHSSKNGTTTLSASGMQVYDDCVLAPASIVAPFLRPACRDDLPGCNHASLLHGTQLSLVNRGASCGPVRLAGFLKLEGLERTLALLRGIPHS